MTSRIETLPAGFISRNAASACARAFGSSAASVGDESISSRRCAVKPCGGSGTRAAWYTALKSWLRAPGRASVGTCSGAMTGAFFGSDARMSSIDSSFTDGEEGADDGCGLGDGDDGGGAVARGG